MKRGSPAWIVYDPKNPLLAHVGPVVWDLRRGTWRYDPEIQRRIIDESEQGPRGYSRRAHVIVPYPRSVAEGEVLIAMLYRDHGTSAHRLLLTRIGIREAVRWSVRLNLKEWSWGPVTPFHPAIWMGPDGTVAAPGHWITPDGKIVRDRRLNRPVSGIGPGRSIIRGLPEGERRSDAGRHGRVPGDPFGRGNRSRLILYSGKRASIQIETVRSVSREGGRRLAVIDRESGSEMWSCRVCEETGATWTPDGLWAVTSVEDGGRCRLFSGFRERIVPVDDISMSEFGWGGIRVFPLPEGQWAVLSNHRMWILRGSQVMRVIPIPTIIIRTFPNAALFGGPGVFLFVPDDERDLDDLISDVCFGMAEAERRVDGNIAVVYRDIIGDRRAGFYLYPARVTVPVPPHLLDVTRAGVMAVEETGSLTEWKIHFYRWNGERITTETMRSAGNPNFMAFPASDRTFILGFTVSPGVFEIRRYGEDGTAVSNVRVSGWNPSWKILKIRDEAGYRLFVVGDGASTKTVIADPAGGVLVRS